MHLVTQMPCCCDFISLPLLHHQSLTLFFISVPSSITAAGPSTPRHVYFCSVDSILVANQFNRVNLKQVHFGSCINDYWGNHGVKVEGQQAGASSTRGKANM